MYAFRLFPRGPDSGPLFHITSLKSSSKYCFTFHAIAAISIIFVIRKMKKLHAGRDLGFLIKKSGIAFTVKAGGMVAQYLFVYTLARLSGPGTLGTFTLSYTVIQLLVILSLLGLDNLLTRKVATASAVNDPTSLRKAYQIAVRTSIISSVLISTLLFFLSPLLAENIFRKPGLTSSLQIISISLPFFTSVVIHASAFRGIKNMFGFTFYKTTIPIINTLVLLLSYYLQLDLLPAVGFTMASILTAFGYAAGWKKKLTHTGTIEYQQRDYSTMLRESLPMLMTGSIFFILNWIDNLFIGYFRNESDVGIYDTAFKIATASAIILQAVNAIQAPVFAEYKAGGDLRKLRQSVFQSNRLLFLLTLPLTLLILAMPEFLLGIFGSEFKAGAMCLSILAVSNMLSAICGSVGILLQMTGYQNIYNKIIMAAAGLSIVLNLLLIPVWGITGAAIASSAAKIFQNLGASFVVYKKLGIFSVYIPWLTNKILQRKNQQA